MREVSQADVSYLLGNIVDEIDNDEFVPDRIVAICQNGVELGGMLSSYYAVPLTCVSWDVDDVSERESNCWLSEDADKGERLLVVTAVTDTALMDSLIKDWESNVKKKSKWEENVRYVSLFEHENEVFEVDYIGETVPRDVELEFHWDSWWK